jgi:hypothetical protein
MPMVRQLMVMTVCHCLMVSHDAQHMRTYIMSIFYSLIIFETMVIKAPSRSTLIALTASGRLSNYI